MMKLVFILMLTGLIFTAKGQIPDHIPMMNSTWDLLDTKSYKRNANGIYMIYFPANLRAFDKTTIELPGYMIPIKAGMVHQTFMLSVLPVLQCQFCGQANIPSMVEIHLSKPIAYSEAPIKVKGTLILNSTDDSQSEFIITNAVAEELK
jgi:hypothetical protein